MRFVFFTPVASDSAIGAVSAVAGDELRSRGHSVVEIATEAVAVPRRDRAPEHEAAIEWRHRHAVRAAIADADLVLHHLGNHLGNHLGSVEWLMQVRGAIALHDVFLGNLLLEWLRANPHAATQFVARHPGIPLSTLTAHYRSAAGVIDAFFPRELFSDWFAMESDGVLVHSDYARRLLAQKATVPISTARLPFRTPPAAPAPIRIDRRPRLLTIGHVNDNKLIDVAIQAIASDPRLRGRIGYRVVGPVAGADRAYLERLAADLRVDLTVTGEVEPAALRSELAAADLVLCLRNPPIEAASASAADAMLAGKPIVTVDHGYYAELPDDVGWKLPSGDVRRSLTALLRELVGPGLDLETRGARARRYAASTFRVARYADALERMPAAAAGAMIARLDARFTALREWDSRADSPIGDSADSDSPAALYRRDTAAFRPTES